MADPASWLVISGIVLGAIGTAVSVPINVHNANEQKRQQQAMLQRQSDIARQNAELATQQAEAKAKQVQANAERTRAAQLTQMAGTGIDIANSSFLDVIGESAANQEFDILNTKYQGKLAARQYELGIQENMMRIDNLDSQMQNPLLEGTLATTAYVADAAITAGSKGTVKFPKKADPLATGTITSDGYMGTLGGIA